MKLVFLWLYTLPLDFWKKEKKDGMEYSIKELSKTHEVIKMALTKGEESECTINKIRVVYLRRKNMLSFLQNVKPDFLLISDGRDSNSDILEGLGNETYLACYEHGNYVLTYPKLFDCLFTCSEGRKRNAARANNLALSRIKVANHGVDTSLFYPRKNKEKKYLAIGVGDFRVVKRWTLLIKAWRLVPEGKLLIIGRMHTPLANPAYVDQCKGLRKKYGLDDRIEFLDFIPHDKLPEMFSQAEMLVHSSRREAGARSLIEGMAMGLPTIVCSDCEGNVDLGLCRGDMIRAGPTPRDLAAAIIFLKEDKEERERIGMKVSKRIRKEFTYEMMLRAFTEVLEDVERAKKDRHYDH